VQRGLHRTSLYYEGLGHKNDYYQCQGDRYDQCLDIFGQLGPTQLSHLPSLQQGKGSSGVVSRNRRLLLWISPALAAFVSDRTKGR